MTAQKMKANTLSPFLVDKQQWGKTKQELDTVKLRAVFKRQANASYIYRSQVGFLIQS